MKRRQFLGAAAGTAAAALGIPSLLETPRTEAARSAASTTVTFWQFNTDTPSLTIWRKLIAAFEVKNPDVKVNMVIVPWSEQAQKLTTAISTGAAPDVSMMGNDIVAEYAAINALAQMDSYFEAWSKEVGRDITLDFYPGDHAYYRFNGHWYASPLTEETRLIYLRTSMLKAAGIDPSKPPLTYQGMLQLGMKLNKKGVFGWGIPGGINYFTVQSFMTFYLAWGAQYINAQGMCGFDSPEFRAALQFYTDIYLKHKLTPPDTPIYDNVKLEALFQAGKIAMLIDGPWLLNQITDPRLKADITLAQLPRGPKMRAAFLGGWPLVMWAQSKNQAATFRFIRYITDPAQGLSPFCDGAGQLPGRKSVAVRAPWNAMPTSIFINQLNFAYPYQYPHQEIPQMGSLETDAIQTAVQNVMLGKATVDQATKDLVAHINAVLQP
jgi:ABC-type glycerol-3-phosphate transport system substrate-binding protein